MPQMTLIAAAGLAASLLVPSLGTSGSWSGPQGTYPTQFVLPKAVDVGLVFGATLGLGTGRRRARFDARYTLGVTRFPGTGVTGAGTVENPDVELKNNALTLTAGWALSLRPRSDDGGLAP